MLIIYIKIGMLVSLLMTSLFAEAGSSVVTDEYHRVFPKMFCKPDIPVDECLNWVSSYVAQKHIRANNTYYRKVVDGKVKALFKQHVEKSTEPYDPNKQMMLSAQVEKELINDIARLWLRTGSLPNVK
ncbi:hypothetical protein [Idiomarina sp. UBA4206]|uniref:hypothetical protein n=1 Tax=Idiomarina sp. UBA4206 TaxID=1946644 RepID=UPI00257AB063|nr:hypothetical protein [Idiomarina sp. UBA4206]